MKRISLFITMCLVLMVSSGCYAAGPWKGRVIDSETKQPIEGAAVVAVWTKSLRGPAGREGRFLDAKETLTDNEGRFEIPSFNAINIVFFREVTGPEFTIYKPGYGAYPRHQTKPEPPIPYETIFEENENTVELPRYSEKEDRLEALRVAESLIIFVPKDIISGLMTMTNEERINMGLKPLDNPEN